MSIYSKSSKDLPSYKNSAHVAPKKRRDLSMRIFTPAPVVELEEKVGTEEEKNREINAARRMGLIDPNLKMSDITRLPRSSQGRLVVPDSDKVFQFQCKGTLGGDTLVAGKQVEWRATFNRPLEQLLYPSLQRFDVAKYESRVKMRQRLHGDSKAVANHSNSPTDHKDSVKYFNDAGDADAHLRLEPLPDKMLPTNEAILFVHTPQWTVQITEPAEHASEPALSLGEEIDLQGEKYLRNEIKEGVARKEAQRQSRIDTRDVKTVEVVSSWSSRRVATREIRPVGREIRPGRSPKDDAQILYTQLLRQSQEKEKEEAMLQDKGVSSSEIFAFNRLKKSLSDSVPGDQKHLLNGILFYRHANDNHTAQLEAQRETEQTLMKTHQSMRVSPVRTVNTFASRVTLRRTTLGTSLSPLSPQGLAREVEQPSPEKFSRVQRAIEGRNVGLNQSRRRGMLHTGSLDLGGGVEDERQDELEEIEARNNLRQAQDTLLLQQLDRGVLPEQFIKRASDDPRHVSIILSKYSIGDDRGVCLGCCLESVHHLECLGISDNRLTKRSLPVIIRHMSFATLLALDLSLNDMHEDGIHALASFFKARTVVEDLDLSSCGITCADTKDLFSVLASHPNRLQEVRISGNEIAAEGTEYICRFLTSPNCRLELLDLSWNHVGEQGAVTIAAALPGNNSLLLLNLASNGLGDNGGQRIMHSMRYHGMQKLNLSQNDLSHRTCFVAAQTLKKRKSLVNLDLTFNPLGEAGARCLFRNILRGITCWVFMQNCSFRDTSSAFNATYPTSDNPYSLQLSEPYRAAILEELLAKFVEDPDNCSFDSFSYKDLPGVDQQLSLVVVDGEVVVKSTGEKYEVPDSGVVRITFQQAVSVPTIVNAIKPAALNLLMMIIEAGRDKNRKKDVDMKKVWLLLLCQDVYFTVAQAQAMIDRFQSNGTIGDGSLTKLDLIKSVWKFLIDTENMYDFMYRNTSEVQRKDLVYALTLKRYRFNWANPTAFWSLNLEDKVQRSILMQLIAINNFESEFGRLHSGRGDTSQHGNWYNFRNARYTVGGETRECVVDRDFVKNPPEGGTVEFDFVSTTRPLMTPGLQVATDDEMFTLCERLSLSSRKKMSNAASLFVLMDLQLAATMHYFTVAQVGGLLDCFQDHWELQARVIVCMFSRIVDLHMMDVLLRHLDGRTQQEVLRRLGCLNVINPLKISFDYVFKLSYLDNRVLLIALMELASMESADQIVEETNTELPIATLYGSYTRTLNETRPETMRFQFTDFGQRSKTVAWAARKDLIKKFLVGTTPTHDDLYRVIGMYKELEAAGELTQGPVDLQYLSFQKTLKSPASRSSKSNKQMVALMRAQSGANVKKALETLRN